MKNQIVVHNFRICFFGFSKNFRKVFTDGGSQKFLFWWGGGGGIVGGRGSQNFEGKFKIA